VRGTRKGSCTTCSAAEEEEEEEEEEEDASGVDASVEKEAADAERPADHGVDEEEEGSAQTGLQLCMHAREPEPGAGVDTRTVRSDRSTLDNIILRRCVEIYSMVEN
jgi:hypothetical protein